MAWWAFYCWLFINWCRLQSIVSNLISKKELMLSNDKSRALSSASYVNIPIVIGKVITCNFICNSISTTIHTIQGWKVTSRILLSLTSKLDKTYSFFFPFSDNFCIPAYFLVPIHKNIYILNVVLQKLQKLNNNKKCQDGVWNPPHPFKTQGILDP